MRPLPALLPALLGAFLLLAAPTLATQPGWPALHDVARVAPDDVLNVRAGPGASHPVIATLEPDARGVEVIRPSDDARWGLVNAGEGTGWVSLAFLDRRPGQWRGATPALRRCSGTEPFWSLAVDGEAAALEEFGTGAPAIAGRVLARPASTARSDRHGLVLDLGGLRAASVRYEACGDGMSDRAYGLAIDVIGGGTVLSGCCSLAP